MPRTTKPRPKLRLRRIGGAWWIQDGKDLWGDYPVKVDAIETRDRLEAFYEHCDEPGFISCIPPEKKHAEPEHEELPDVEIEIQPLILGEEL